MNQDRLEELFERNADMRLLERRHQEVAAPVPGGATRRVGSAFGAESIVPGANGEVVLQAAPRMRLEIAAAPQSGVIPGALVGVAIDVCNDGTAPAPEATLTLSLPPESAYRDGSLRLDGRELTESDRLFTTGIGLPRLPGESSLKLTFQLQVLAGVTPLILQPRLQTDGVPVVGTVGISIKRGTIAPTAPPNQPPPRPFYELEEDELDEIVGVEAEQPILPPVIGPEPAPRALAPEPEPLAAEPEPLAPRPEPEPLVLAFGPEPAPVVLVTEPEPEAVAPEPATAAEPPRAAPAVAAPAVRQAAPYRYRAIGAAELAPLERLTAASVPGPIAHLLLISRLACTQGPDGTDIGGFDAAVRRNGETLGRALVLQRLGKPAAFLVTQTLLDALAPEAAPPAAPIGAGLLLQRPTRRNDTTTIAALLRRTDRDPTLRFHLALLALFGEALHGVAHAARAADCAVSLVAYRAKATAWLGPACVASTGRPGLPLPAAPPALDAAARQLVAALKAAL